MHNNFIRSLFKPLYQCISFLCLFILYALFDSAQILLYLMFNCFDHPLMIVYCVCTIAVIVSAAGQCLVLNYSCLLT